MSFYDALVVLQAVLTTLLVFIALTIFTVQSRIDFSGWGPL